MNKTNRCTEFQLYWYDDSTCFGQPFCPSSAVLSRMSALAELVRNLVAHGDAREGKLRGNWRMEWVVSTLTPPPDVVYPALLKLMRTPRLPAVDLTDAPTDLNGLVRLGERRNLVSARVPSRSARAIIPAFASSHRLFLLLLHIICEHCLMGPGVA